MTTTQSASKQKNLVLAVKIDRSLGLGKNVIEAAAGDWIINKEKANRITTLVAISKQTVKEVFTVSNPNPVSGKRIKFYDIKIAPRNLRAQYLGLGPYGFRGAVKYL